MSLSIKQKHQLILVNANFHKLAQLATQLRCS